MTSIESVQRALTGRLLTPDDAEFQTARLSWNRTIDHHPAYVLIPKTAQDVALGVNFARENGLPVAAQSTGHGVHNPADGALLIWTREMNGFAINADRRTVRAEAGVVWEPVLEAAAPLGLAPLVGTSAHVGLVGYALGGGIGWLARKYGLAADSVREIELVTADGIFRRASETENPDLFWALRGGRGGVGIVTALTLDLYPVAEVYGGTLRYPGEIAAEALRFFRDWSQALPDEMTSKISIVKFPNSPYLPEILRGKTEITVRGAYAGDAESGARLIQPWLDWRTPLKNTFAQIPFKAVADINEDPVDPSPGVPSSELFDTLTDAAIDILARRALDPASPVVLTEIRHAGGAMSRRGADFSAIGHREAQYWLLTGGVAPTPEVREGLKAAFAALNAELRPYTNGGMYVNYAIGDAARERAKTSFTADGFARLTQIRAKYDPSGVFRFAYGRA